MCPGLVVHSRSYSYNPCPRTGMNLHSQLLGTVIGMKKIFPTFVNGNIPGGDGREREFPLTPGALLEVQSKVCRLI